MSDWNPQDRPAPAPLTVAGWGRVLVKGVALGGLTYGGLAVLLLVRLVERPFFGASRPYSPWVTQFVCRGAVRIIGLGYRRSGTPMAGRGALVANHSSWLDIFALNASDRLYFVSKSEVARWPFVGWLARATGTLFIERDPKRAKVQQAQFEDRLMAGHRLMFFPEGTSTDGLRVLGFKSTLFAAFYSHQSPQPLFIQPVAIRYHGPPRADPRFYGWWGSMTFAPHLAGVLAAPRQGTVEVVFLEPVAIARFTSRKDLAAWCEARIREATLGDATP